MALSELQASEDRSTNPIVGIKGRVVSAGAPKGLAKVLKLRQKADDAWFTAMELRRKGEAAKAASAFKKAAQAFAEAATATDDVAWSDAERQQFKTDMLSRAEDAEKDARALKASVVAAADEDALNRAIKVALDGVDIALDMADPSVLKDTNSYLKEAKQRLLRALGAVQTEKQALMEEAAPATPTGPTPRGQADGRHLQTRQLEASCEGHPWQHLQ